MYTDIHAGRLKIEAKDEFDLGYVWLLSLIYLFSERSSSSFRINLIFSVCPGHLSGSMESEQKPLWKKQVVRKTGNRQNLEMFYPISHSIAWL